jgi:gliding motility-associated lipoprotein GldD
MKTFSSRFILYCLIPYLLICGCNEPSYTPKPRGYPRVILPQKAYQKFGEKYCQFTFDYPTYATIEQEALFFDEKAPSDCWFNIKINSLNAEIHCSYYDIKNENTFEKLKKDAFQLAGKHNIKADYIDELPVKKPNNVSGFVFDIEGSAASPFQFYLTDSSKHFLRGALYFNTQSRADSLKPIVEFMKVDIMNMINTFEWR